MLSGLISVVNIFATLQKVTSFINVLNLSPNLVTIHCFSLQTVDSTQLEKYFLAQKDPKLREEFELENRRSKDNSPSTKMINVSYKMFIALCACSMLILDCFKKL